MNKKTRLALLALGAFWGNAQGEAPQTTRPTPAPASLMDTLVSAYQSNSDLQTKIHEAYKRHEVVPEAMAGFRPDLSASMTTGVKRQDNQDVHVATGVADPNPPATRRLRKQGRSQSMGVTLSQSLFRGGGDMAKLSGADAQTAATYYDFLNSLQETLQAAVKSHLDIYYQRRNVIHSKNNLKFLREHAAAVRASVEVGDKTQTDIATAEARLSEAEAMLARAEADLEGAEANYEAVVGQVAPVNLEFPAEIPGLPLTEEELLKNVSKNSPSVLRASCQEKAAHYAISDAEGNLWPQLSAEVSGSRNMGTGLARTRYNEAAALLRLTIPIYQQGGRQWSSVRAANEDFAAALNAKKSALKKARQESHSSWHSWNATKKRVTQYHAQVHAARRSRDGALLEVKVGARANVEVLDAQRELLQAEINLEQAKRDERLAQFAILSLMGLLNPDYLGMPVEKYDIKGHADTVKYQWVGLANKPLPAPQEEK